MTRKQVTNIPDQKSSNRTRIKKLRYAYNDNNIDNDSQIDQQQLIATS